MKRVVILGAGTGGTMMANKPARALPADSQRLFVPWNQLGERDVARGLVQIGAL